MRVCSWALVLATIGATDSPAQSAKQRMTTLTAGNWSVQRSVDAMTDKVVCTGYHSGNSGAQLSSDKFFVPIRGGLQSVTLRYGEAPAKPMRLATEIEKKVGSIVIEKAEFGLAIQSNRLRIQSLTYANGVVTVDIDLTGVDMALNHIRAGCPAGDKPSPAAAAPKSAPLCNEAIITRLKLAGVTAKQIETACQSQ